MSECDAIVSSTAPTSRVVSRRDVKAERLEPAYPRARLLRRCVVEAELEADRIRREATQLLEDGRREAVRLAADSTREASQAWSSRLAALEAYRAELEASVRDQVVSLAVALAHRVTEMELSRSPERFARWARRAVSRAANVPAIAAVRVRPDDVAAVRSATASLHDMSVIADETLPLGTISVDCAGGGELQTSIAACFDAVRRLVDGGQR